MSTTPTLSEVISRALDLRLAEVRVTLPGLIHSYDALTQQAHVQPLLKEAFLDEDGNRQLEALPIITNVPVMFPSGGGYRITFPVVSGDTCLLIFSASSMDRWLAEGGGPLDPNVDHQHSLTDAVCIVGLRDIRHAWFTAPTDRMTIGGEPGPKIHLDTTEIRLGSNNATEGVGLGNALATHLAAVKAYLDAHVHAGVTAGGAVTGIASASPAVPAVASTFVKVALNPDAIMT